MIITPSAEYWSLHTHSNYSNGDALPTVKNIVDRAKALNQRAIGLTDHGNIAGSVELYTEASRAGLKCFPGSELYYVPSIAQHKLDRKNKNIKASRFHMGVHAYTMEGYENLVNLSTISHEQHFHKPLVEAQTFADLAEAGKLGGLAVTTGCHFGLAVQLLITHGERAAMQWIATLESFFPNNVFVEAQSHEIEHEDAPGWDDLLVTQSLHGIALHMGLPLVITQDSHYVNEKDRTAHETLKRLSSWSDDPDEATFPGDGFHMVDDRWMWNHHTPEVYSMGIEGLNCLYNKNHLEIPVLDNYAYSVPDTVDDPAGEMERRVNRFLDDRVMEDEYYVKAKEEIEVINEAGMAAYMILVATITDHCAEQGWLFQTRGSAAGSVVAWALGITQVDPIHWDLRFERFLSKDRTHPPDVDLDIQHDKRDDLIKWLRTQFSVTAIGTWMKFSIENDEDDEGKGSIMVKYYQMTAKTHGPKEWDEIPVQVRNELHALNHHEAYTGMGRNAAGVIITNNPSEVSRLVPLHHSTSVPEGVSQFNKDDIEALGLVKLDILGSKTLTVLARAAELIDEGYIDRLLPIERENLNMIGQSKDVYREISKGQTDGVFQLEGWSTRKGCKDLKPTSVHDVIAAMALFRPATLDSGATSHYIERKHKREQVPKMHAIINKVTKKTMGILLYQEQVIDLLRELSMEADDLTKFLKAVKASNKNIGNAQKVIDGYMPWIEKRAREEGFTDNDWEWLKNAFDAFGGYSFNRAHSTIYGLTAWRCAFLAHRYPLEFHTALLDVASEGADRKKENGYVRAARDRGLRISRPDINQSGSGYAIDRVRGVIRRGLGSVKGVGHVAASELVGKRPSGGYKSLDDLIGCVRAKAVSGSKNYTAVLRKTGQEDYSELNGVLGALYAAEVLDTLIKK